MTGTNDAQIAHEPCAVIDRRHLSSDYCTVVSKLGMLAWETNIIKPVEGRGRGEGEGEALRSYILAGASRAEPVRHLCVKLNGRKSVRGSLTRKAPHFQMGSSIFRSRLCYCKFSFLSFSICVSSTVTCVFFFRSPQKLRSV